MGPPSALIVMDMLKMSLAVHQVFCCICLSNFTSLAGITRISSRISIL